MLLSGTFRFFETKKANDKMFLFRAFIRSSKKFFSPISVWFLVLAGAQVPSRAHADVLQYACGM
jgi:hypothetical protein